MSKIEEKSLEIEKKKSQAKYLQAFIDDLSNNPNVLETYDEDVWVYLVEKVIANKNGSITFQSRNSKEITID